MNIYRISQNINDRYDTYDSAVVCAETEDEARKIHPSPFTKFWRDNKWFGIDVNGKEYQSSDGYSSNWVTGDNLKEIKIEYIGVAKDGIEKGVIVSSFNAG
jgi:hypothetical protein